MKKFVLLVIALLAIVSLAGCGGGDNDTNGNGNGNGNGDGDGNGTETAQWAAYAFGDTVKPASGSSGKVQSFVYVCTITMDEEVQQYKLECTNEGTETVTDGGASPVDCYKIKHRVTVVKDDTASDHPDWSEMTFWIPTNLKTTDSQVFIKATYVDSDNHQGSWSQSSASVDFYGYEYYWMFIALYGWGWGYFNGFAEGGTQHLDVGSWDAGVYHYDVSQGSQTIGGYTFSTRTVDMTWAAAGSTASYKGVFSPSLPLPIYLKVSGSGEGSSSLFEYTLTDLKLG